MYAGPRLMSCADLDHREIERPESFTDHGQLIRQSCITGEKEIVARGFQDPRRPQGLVTVAESPAGEMLSRSRGQRHRTTGKRVVFPPVQLGDQRGIYSKLFESGSDSE